MNDDPDAAIWKDYLDPEVTASIDWGEWLRQEFRPGDTLPVGVHTPVLFEGRSYLLPGTPAEAPRLKRKEAPPRR